MSIDALQKDEFFSAFNPPPHVFLSKQHLEMHLQNSNDCIYLADLSCGLGIFLRVSESIAKSPYAAPFGGIFSKDYRTDWNALNQFISEIGKYLLSTGVENLRIAFPAPIYSKNITTKVINSLINGAYPIRLMPEINSHISLPSHDKLDYPKNIKEIIRKTSRAGLKIKEVYEEWEKLAAYEIVAENRKSKSRVMSISYSHLRSLDKVFETRYFIIKNQELQSVASAITFKSTSKIVYAQFWGDTMIGRGLNAMDFLSVSMVDIFKEEGFSILDLGVSTEQGMPNAGLLRFKESHLFESTLKFTIDVELS